MSAGKCRGISCSYHAPGRSLDDVLRGEGQMVGADLARHEAREAKRRDHYAGKHNPADPECVRCRRAAIARARGDK